MITKIRIFAKDELKTPGKVYKTSFQADSYKWRTKRFLKSHTTNELFVLLKVNPIYWLDNQITFWDLLNVPDCCVLVKIKLAL